MVQSENVYVCYGLSVMTGALGVFGKKILDTIFILPLREHTPLGREEPQPANKQQLLGSL